jgi:hypothetical protein
MQLRRKSSLNPQLLHPNQNYIFATNKLRENVGASQLTYEVGTAFVEQARKGVAGISLVISASGKAILLADDETAARMVVSAVTLRALKDAPGLDVRGVVDSAFGPGDSVHDRISQPRRSAASGGTPAWLFD